MYNCEAARVAKQVLLKRSGPQQPRQGVLTLVRGGVCLLLALIQGNKQSSQCAVCLQSLQTPISIGTPGYHATDAIAALARIAENRNKMANRAGEHKQVPNTVGMFELIVMVEHVKSDAQGVGDTPRS